MSVYEELSAHDIPFTEVEDAVLGWVREALELRHGAAGDPQGKLGYLTDSAGIPEIQNLLLRVRARSDRVDELLAKTTQAKGRAKRALDHAQFTAEVAYDSAAQNLQASRRAEFTSARERHADAALMSLEQRRLAHHGARLVSVTLEAYDVVKQVHWQLDAIRKDLRASLHALQFESSLER